MSSFDNYRSKKLSISSVAEGYNNSIGDYYSAAHTSGYTLWHSLSLSSASRRLRHTAIYHEISIIYWIMSLEKYITLLYFNIIVVISNRHRVVIEMPLFQHAFRGYGSCLIYKRFISLQLFAPYTNIT